MNNSAVMETEIPFCVARNGDILYDNYVACISDPINFLFELRISWFGLFLSLICIIISIRINKTYSWQILHLQIFQVLSLEESITESYLWNAKFIPKFISKIVLSTIISYFPYVSLLLLTLTRFIGLYFPNFNEKWITNKTILPIIVIWDLIFLIPNCYWNSLDSSYWTCKEYPKDVCDPNITLYYKFLDEDSARYMKYLVDLPDFQKRENFDSVKMDADGINYTQCFEYKDCRRFRKWLLETFLPIFVLSAFTLSTIVLSSLLLFLILKNLKKQLAVNKASVKLLLRISILIFIQSLLLLIFSFGNIYPMIQSYSDNVFLLFLLHLNPSIYVFYVVADSLLILFVLTDYREKLLFLMPKRKNEVAARAAALENTKTSVAVPIPIKSS